MKIFLSIAEIRAKFNIPLDAELVIDKSIEPNGSDWYVVPQDWQECRCPHNYDPDIWIEVQYRDGESRCGPQRHAGIDWRQDGVAGDIVQYRFIGSKVRKSE